MPKGYLALVLHAHLPFVRHPEFDVFLEERWLFEAITETYIPLIKMLNRQMQEQIPCKITLSVSPPLLAMLQDGLLQERYKKHLEKLIELSSREQERNKHNPHFHYLAGMYRQLFEEARDIFVNQYGMQLAAAFRHLHQSGLVELMTTTATHGILPLLSPQPRAVAAQVRAGVEYFEEVFGFRPRGIWLPECGYYPGLDSVLKDQGIRFFITEAHGVTNAGTTPFYGVHAPLYAPSGAAAFARDQGSTREVWSAREGFPGDPDYREFYRDIGHDLDYSYIHPYIAGDVRVDTGIKYHRITGPTACKEPYYPEAAKNKAALHADIFMRRRASHIEYLAQDMEAAPIIVAPFDAELFGHWWFEGPQWLDFFIRKTAYDQSTFELITPGAYLDCHPVHQMGMPATSTWGHQGYFEVWLNNKNDWMYPQLYECARRMEALSDKYARGVISALTRRALNQCLRELLLAQSSDWPFIIHTGTATEYAARRFRDHVARFHYIANAIENNAVSKKELLALEEMDAIFPAIDFKMF